VSAPTHIRALTDRGELELQWPDGGTNRLPFRLLREECPCAACVDENTGRRILNVAAIPHDIRPTGMSFTGNYALKIAWSDGHNTGLYTWDHLAKLCGRSE
jgi:DUF971 family protein